MIFVTGDIHKDIDIKKLSNSNFPFAKKLTRSDYIIICGDFCFPHYEFEMYTKSKHDIRNHIPRSEFTSYKYWIKWLALRPYTILWCDGNHDCHPFGKNQPVVLWKCGRVHIYPEADNVLHLIRGEYYTIEGKTFWCMGGAASSDADRRAAGILTSNIGTVGIFTNINSVEATML